MLVDMIHLLFGFKSFGERTPRPIVADPLREKSLAPATFFSFSHGTSSTYEGESGDNTIEWSLVFSQGEDFINESETWLLKETNGILSTENLGSKLTTHW